MKYPFFTVPVIAVSSEVKTSSVNLVECRTLSVSCRVTYNGAATSGVRVNIYYAPDGRTWDTVPYTHFDITLTAGEVVQETEIIDMPEHGAVAFGVENLDAAQTATEVKTWYSIQSWQGKCEEEVEVVE